MKNPIVLCLCLLSVVFVVDLHSQAYRWDYLAKLNTARRSYLGMNFAIAISPCKVLVAGGYVGGNGSSYGQPTTSCEIIDVCCGTVSPTGSMNIARAEHTLLLAPDSSVIAISGITQITDQNSSSGTHTASVEKYNRATGTWTTLGNLLIGRRQAQAVFISSTEILVVGGRLPNLGTINSVEIFNISTGTSQAMNNYTLPVNMHNIGTSSAGSTIVAGGRNGGTNAVRTRLIQKYTRSTDSYTQIALLPDSVRSSQIRKLFDGRLLISGGVMAESAYRATKQIVIENNDNFGAVVNMNTARWGHGIGQVNNDSCIFFAGQILSNGQTSNLSEWYSLSQNQVYNGPNLPVSLGSFAWETVPRTFNGSGQVSDATVIAIGGVANSGEFSPGVPRDTIFVLRRCSVPDSVRYSKIFGTCLSQHFTIDSLNLCRTPTSIRWSYGDSTSSVGQPWWSNHTYPSGGNYVVKATLLYANCGDSLVLQRTINVSQTATIAANPRLLYRCARDSGIVLYATGGIRYRWTPGATLSDSTIANPVAKPTQDTKYYVYGFTADSCYGLDSVFVRFSNGQANAGSDVAICSSGDSTLLAVSIPGTIRAVQWTPKIGLACDTCALTKAKPAVTTRYIVNVVDSSGCVATDTVQVNVRTGATAKVAPGPLVQICASSDSIPLTVAPTAGIKQVRWTPNIGIGCDTCIKTKVKPKSTIKYVAYITDSLGCVTVDTVLVKVGGGSSAIQSGPAQFMCFKGDSAIIRVNGKVMAIQWTPPASVSCATCPVTTVKPAATRYFTYTATDSSGCTQTDSIKVTVLPKSTVDIAPDTVLCGSTALQMNALGSYQSLQWVPATGLSCANCPSVLVIPRPGQTITYTVIAHNGNSADCESRDSIRVKFARGIEGQLLDREICPGDSTVFQLRPFGGKVKWTPSTGLSCDTCRSVVARPNVTTRYILTGDSSGCISRDTVDVLVQATTLKVPASLSGCAGQNIFISATTNSKKIQWSPAGDFVHPDSASTFVRTAVSKTYYVTVGSGPCAKTDSVRVTVLPSPIFTATPLDTVLCKSGQVHIQTTVNPPGTTIAWNANSDLSCYNCPDPVARPSAPDVTYYAILHTPGGCDSTISVHIRTVQPPHIQVTPRGVTSLCFGDSLPIHVSDTSHARFQWSSSTGSTTTLDCDTCADAIAHPAVGKTTYYVLASTGIGCEALDSVMVDVSPQPIISLSSDTTLCLGKQMQLHVGGGTKYQWQADPTLSCTDCDQPLASPQTTTTYHVRVMNAAGCFVDSSVTLTMIPCAVKPQILTTPINPFIACDSGRSVVSITNEGDVILSVTDISLQNTNHATIAASDLVAAKAQLPMILHPKTDTLKFAVTVIPDQAGAAWVDLGIQFTDSLRIVRVPIVSYKRDVQFSMQSLYQARVDTTITIPISASSLYWNELKIKDSLRLHIAYDPSGLEYKSVARGKNLPADWTVGYDSSASNSGNAYFSLRGTSSISADGELVQPTFHTLLSNVSSLKCSVDATFSSLRIDCAGQDANDSHILLSACALNLRQVEILSTGFGIVSIQPNPATTSELSVKYTIGFEGAAELLLYNVRGEEVTKLVSGAHKVGSYELRLSTSSLSNGEYMLVLKSAGTWLTKSLIIDR